jgi:hypothetical protein
MIYEAYVSRPLNGLDPELREFLPPRMTALAICETGQAAKRPRKPISGVARNDI